jgi:hypothetical protein
MQLRGKQVTDPKLQAMRDQPGQQSEPQQGLMSLCLKPAKGAQRLLAARPRDEVHQR